MSKIRKRRKKRNARYFLTFLAVLFLILAAGNTMLKSSGLAPAHFLSETDEGVNLSHLYSKNAVLMDWDTERIVSEHNSQKRIYPASLTKIMTAVLAIENTGNLDETVTVPDDIFPSLYTENASMAGFQPGEEITLQDLLYGILLPSGAECCLTFAERIAGTEDAFAEMMNLKAKELGMSDTHFCNSTGLHDSDHYSTVQDLAVLLKYALDNANFRAVFTSSQHTVGPTAEHPEGFTFWNTMFASLDSPQVTGGEILGGKTGYTDEAGLCLASLAEINGTEYILVTAHADGSHQTEPFHILDAVNVYNQIGAQSTQ